MDGSTIERWPNRFSSSSFIDAKRRCTLGLITEHNAALAQSVERRSRKAKVAGSIPAGGSLIIFNPTNGNFLLKLIHNIVLTFIFELTRVLLSSENLEPLRTS